jgi:hypothetical protein
MDFLMVEERIDIKANKMKFNITNFIIFLCKFLYAWNLHNKIRIEANFLT